MISTPTHANASAPVDTVLIDRLMDLLNEVFLPTGRVVLNASEALNFVPQATDLTQ